MRIIFFLGLLVALFFPGTSSARWEGITSVSAEKASCRTVSQSGDETVLFFRIEGFEVRDDESGAGQRISSPGCATTLEAGAPELPVLSASVIVPEGNDMDVEVISTSYRDYPNMEIVPSRGNLYRNQDPSSVALSRGPVYSVDEWYPASLVGLREPYLLRDFTGQTVVVHPFRYDPVRKMLRLYYAMTVRVRPSGDNKQASRRAPLLTVDQTYASIYAAHFVNYNALNYTPLTDRGSMLIITDSAFRAVLEPFVSWKRQAGQSVEVVDVQSIVQNPYYIKTFVQDYYLQNGLTFLLLVGDGSQVPPYPSSSGDSDPSYGYIIGNDSYAEVIVGRFSANTAEEVAVQVRKVMEYEKYPLVDSLCYSRATCIASDQGPGDDNEYDFEHARMMRQDLLNYGYTGVDELYDGSQGVADFSGDPTSQDLVQSINEGRSLLTYTGHGSTTSCGTTGFSLADIPSLTNTGKLPFFWSVACVQGDFANSNCLAEGLLRAVDSSGAPTGAVATLMSTINQSWDPPMDAQDEMVDLLVETYPSNIQRTFGGLSVNGCMHMNDQYGSAGAEMTDTWTCFGDPSLQVRTAQPLMLAVTHPAQIDDMTLNITASVSIDSAWVCLTLHDSIVSTALSLGGQVNLLFNHFQDGDTLLLTATAYNAIPYQGQIPVVAMNTGLVGVSIETLELFPNPATDRLTIRSASNWQSLRLIDVTGREVRTLENSGTSRQISLDVSALTSGFYSVVVMTDAGSLSRQWMKQ